MTAVGSLTVHVLDGEQFASVAADLVMAQLPNRDGRLGVATGTTPLGVYAELARRAAQGDVDLREATVVALDEYVGLRADHPLSYARYVREQVAVPLGIRPERVHVPDGSATNPAIEAARFEALISSLGGVDVQIAGLGSNGHLAFNEPGSDPASVTRVVRLSESTRRDNSRLFSGGIAAVPTLAITQGLATIMSARAVVLLVRGEQKAEALAAAALGPVTPQLPASILQRHPAVTVIADPAAAALW